ncbi:hypothetical protein HELRODRAFT_169601 [Helobdella robusta]|uniref:Uncharacterized protein n=1 Tax=Helobdella robusta TaxID=6412 RepID=T1F255_HELRO|nr:hypothetical protein HELRODRAFT_169601 [Helobdella robusta]ESO07898.1 hypothetical protein HELRODRAFT_169601 [Helobdella robusta]
MKFHSKLFASGMQSPDNKLLESNTGSKSPSSITPVPSPTARGLVGFFRRRRKSTSSNNENDYNELEMEATSESVKPKPSPTDKMPGGSSKSKDVYGNYATVSGTGANLLKDMFNKKYRSSVRFSGNFETEKTRKPSHSSPLGTLFKFRSKKDIIKEERSPSPTEVEAALNNNASNNSNDKHHHKPDMHRSRHISIGSDARKFVTPSSSKLGSLMPTSTKVKGFFDSFRQKSSRETTPEVAAMISPTTQNSILGTTIVYAPGGKKKKKFRVTKALEDDPTQFGPNNFIEMYRKNRADSESKRISRIHQLSSSPTFSKAPEIQLSFYS